MGARPGQKSTGMLCSIYHIYEMCPPFHIQILYHSTVLWLDTTICLYAHHLCKGTQKYCMLDLANSDIAARTYHSLYIHLESFPPLFDELCCHLIFLDHILLRKGRYDYTWTREDNKACCQKWKQAFLLYNHVKASKESKQRWCCGCSLPLFCSCSLL